MDQRNKERLEHAASNMLEDQWLYESPGYINCFKIKLFLTDNFHILCHDHSLRLHNMEKTNKLHVHDYHSRVVDIQNNRKRKSTKQAEPHSHPI